MLDKSLTFYTGRVFLGLALGGTAFYMISNLDKEDTYRYSIIRFNHYVSHNSFEFLNEYYL